MVSSCEGPSLHDYSSLVHLMSPVKKPQNFIYLYKLYEAPLLHHHQLARVII